MVWYSQCPICGTIHNDGAHVMVRGKHRFICLGCADDMSAAANSDDERRAWLEGRIPDSGVATIS